LTFSGIATNSDPSRGVTARDVSEAIQERARALVPSATRISWTCSGNRSILTLAPVDDIPGLASRIEFGTATVNGNQIVVQISPDFISSVPRLPAEPPIEAGNSVRRGRSPEPEFPPDADAVAKSLIRLKELETRHKKTGLNGLMLSRPDDRLAEVVHAVILLLGDEDGWRVGDAIKVRARWKSPAAIPALIKLTDDQRFNVRNKAIKAPGKTKDQREVEPIIFRIKDAMSAIVLRVGPLLAAERKKPAGGAGSRQGNSRELRFERLRGDRAWVLMTHHGIDKTSYRHDSMRRLSGVTTSRNGTASGIGYRFWQGTSSSMT
jgi:hypothetical protein